LSSRPDWGWASAWTVVAARRRAVQVSNIFGQRIVSF
jgi:hypothetical protein